MKRRAPSAGAGGSAPLARRLGWFLLLWAAGVGGLAVVGAIVKLVMQAAGMR